MDKIDYLTEDKLISDDQKFVCISFLTDKESQKTLTGIKVRGAFPTYEKACENAKMLQSIDPSFNVFVGEMGKWLPFDPSPDSEQVKNSEYADKLPNIILIRSEKNIGFSAGNNLGFIKAVGEYILYLNPDTVLFKSGLDPLVKYLDKNKQVGVVGPKILNPNRSIQTSCFRFPNTFFYPLYRRANFLNQIKKVKHWRDGFIMSDFARDEIRDVDWLLGACMLVRREAISEAGLFDERFFLFLEDTDWCYRFHCAGWRVVYNPEAWIIHHIERASDERSIIKSIRKKTAWIHIISWLKYYFKHIWRNDDYGSF